MKGLIGMAEKAIDFHQVPGETPEQKPKWNQQELTSGRDCAGEGHRTSSLSSSE